MTQINGFELETSNNSTHWMSQGINSGPTATGPPPALNYSTHPIVNQYETSNNSTQDISQGTNWGPTAAGPPPAMNYYTHPINQANSNLTATGIPPPLNYSTQPSPVTHQHNPYQVPVTGWEEYDLVDIAEREYYYALRQLSSLRDRAANLPKGSFNFTDPSVELAELELKKAARVLDRMIDFMLQQAVQDEPIAPGLAPPSPTYSEFSDIPLFSSRPATPVHGDDSRETDVRKHFA